ncbi:hypothetical protein K9M79_00715 [Candidatus Woesearchaeota archaeon]|nr:hypothetical protein [Candidatus Woesearchaeota archaeon]
MDFKVISEKDNSMLNRKELIAEIIFDAKTPSRAQLVDKVAEAVKADRKLIIVKKIDMKFGQRKATITIRIYKNKELLDRYEDNIRAVSEEKAASEDKTSEDKNPESTAEKSAEPETPSEESKETAKKAE